MCFVSYKRQLNVSAPRELLVYQIFLLIHFRLGQNAFALHVRFDGFCSDHCTPYTNDTLHFTYITSVAEKASCVRNSGVLSCLPPPLTHLSAPCSHFTFFAEANACGANCLRAQSQPFIPPRPHRFVYVVLQRWEGGLRHKVTVGETKGGAAEIEFVCGDFTVLDWSDGE